MEISLENLYIDIGAYTGLTEIPLYFLLHGARYLNSRKLCESLKTLPVAFFSVFKYSCRFGRLLRYLGPPMNTKSVLLWDFRSLHKQLLSNCMRKFKYCLLLLVFAFSFRFP